MRTQHRQTDNTPPTGLRATLKAAMADGYTMNDLTVLRPRGDPYRLDTAASHRDGRWCAEMAERYCEDARHLRDLHYVLATAGTIKPDGAPYTNDEATWEWLVDKASKAARWLGYVPFDYWDDHRNAAPVVRLWTPPEPEAFVGTSFHIEVPSAEDLEPVAWADDFLGSQPYKLVIVGEKSSLDPVLGSVAERHEADLYLPTGEMSDIQIHDMARIGSEDGRHMVVFYVTDCDPSGLQMVISVSRKLQAFRDLTFPDLSFEMRQVALAPAQVKEYGLPSSPLKAELRKDGRRKEQRADRWLAAFGIEQTEINALTALRKGELERLMDEAMRPFFDPTLARRVSEAFTEWRVEAQAELEEQLDPEELDRIRTDAVAKLAQLEEQVEDIRREMRVDVGGIDLPEPVIPEPMDLPEPDGLPLVHSDWAYAEISLALKAHKRYQNGSADR